MEERREKGRRLGGWGRRRSEHVDNPYIPLLIIGLEVPTGGVPSGLAHGVESGEVLSRAAQCDQLLRLVRFDQLDRYEAGPQQRTVPRLHDQVRDAAR